MRCWLVIGFFVLASVGPVAGEVCWNTLRLECPTAYSPDEVYVEVYVTNCDLPLDAFGFEILYRPDWLLFVRGETTNTLVANWIQAAAAPVPNTFARVRVGGYDLVGIAPGTSGVLMRLYFQVWSWVSLDTAVWFDEWSLTDDVAGFLLRECEGGNIPVEGRTWGGVKALYE